MQEIMRPPIWHNSSVFPSNADTSERRRARDSSDGAPASSPMLFDTWRSSLNVAKGSRKIWNANVIQSKDKQYRKKEQRGPYSLKELELQVLEVKMTVDPSRTPSHPTWSLARFKRMKMGHLYDFPDETRVHFDLENFEGVHNHIEGHVHVARARALGPLQAGQELHLAHNLRARTG